MCPPRPAPRDPSGHFVSHIGTSSGIKSAGCPDELIQLCANKEEGLSSLAIAGNENLAEITGQSIKEYNSLKSYFEAGGRQLGDFEQFKQITANQTTFTVLSMKGNVWTWGDGRYESCLGREVSAEYPADLPGIVPDLSDLPTGPIRKISSGGYLTAALTSGNDLYLWGGRPGQTELLDQLSRTPEPLDLDGQDVLDVAVGADHILALTTEHKLYVIGANRNGQLGLDLEDICDWREVPVPLDSKRIVSIHAGYKNSFLVVENII